MFRAVDALCQKGVSCMDTPLGSWPLAQERAKGLRMTDTTPSTQLYLISPLDVSGDFPQRLERALAAGEGLVTAFQFRVKGVDQHEAATLAEPLQAICAAHDCAFIVNDSVPLAKRLKADGVHLGQDDGDPREAREVLGREAQIGVTCHASKHLAMEAGEAGADYVAFGAFYPSTTKDKGDAERPTPEIVDWWVRLFEIPVVAIGGITPENCVPLVQAGADFLAVSGGVWNGDEVAAVKAFAKAIGSAD
jgi:thiamine-phosphate pyrophosphorylase